MMSGKKKLRILCFGDSLTSGFASFGMIAHPYMEKLVETLQAELPDLQIDAREDGKPGDITGFFMNRIVPLFAPGQPKYDWTIILGGTNDLAYNYAPETIFENLQRCWSVALSHGSKVLALTVPEAGVKVRHVEERRNKLNELIKNAQGGNLFVHDHHKAVPYWSMSEDDRQLYWDDHIHLTPSGYDLMGEMIAKRLLEIIRDQGAADPKAKEPHGQGAVAGNVLVAAASPSKASRKKVFKDDDRVFEEETGDSATLTQGYVVVRKKDLD